MSKIKVLPIYPKFPETFWGFRKSLKITGKDAVMPPAGLLTVMAMLPEDKFEPQKVIDLNVEPLTDKHLQDTDIVMTSTMVLQEDSYNEVIDKAHFYGKKVISGGPFPTSYPERNLKADYIVAGEAEVTLQPFLEDFLKTTPARIYTEKSVQGRNLVQLTRGGKVLLENTPIPKWDLINLKKYNSALIQYSRGCPFDCDFCDITHLYGKESRTKTPEQMIKELDALLKTGHKGSVFIVDDNFIGNRKNLKELLPEMIKWQQNNNYPFNFFTEASLNLAWPENKNILESMVNAGFDQVFLGIESCDKEVLDKMGKKQNTKLSTLESVKTIQESGLEVTAGFIIGADEEKPDSFDNLFDIIQKAGIVLPMPGLLTAIKGTRLHKRLQNEGRFREESRGDNTHQLGFNFKPQMNEKLLIENYKKLLGKLFDDKVYYQRCRVLRDRLGPHHYAKRGSNLEGLVFLGRSLIKQLFAKGGFEYAKYLTETALKKPAYFPEAVTQAIKLVHLKSITNSLLASDAYNFKAEELYKQFVFKVKEIQTRYSHNFLVEQEKVVSTAKRIINKAEKRYHKLHEDFKRNATDSLENLKNRIYLVLGNYNLSK